MVSIDGALWRGDIRLISRVTVRLPIAEGSKARRLPEEHHEYKQFLAELECSWTSPNMVASFSTVC